MTINCNGNLIDLTIPKVMGILNITPDSFYDGGRYSIEKNMLGQVEKMVSDGATFIDVGACSTRPNASIVSEEEEIARLMPAINTIMRNFPNIFLSIDTFRAKVARLGIENGACMINDISAGNLDIDMMTTVADLQVPYIMMHMKGNPETMQGLANYDNITKEMLYFFSGKIAQAKSFGINDMIIDPGFGFAKTREHNFQILSDLELFKILELPVLVGMSRKSFIYRTLDTKPEFALNGTTVMNTVAVQKGASILRVHDVKEALETIKLLSEI